VWWPLLHNTAKAHTGGRLGHQAGSSGSNRMAIAAVSTPAITSWENFRPATYRMHGKPDSSQLSSLTSVSPDTLRNRVGVVRAC
jgi:hypothetical protein